MLRDYSYDYEWDVEYCYPDSNVLINKLNIREAEALAVAEREITSIRLAVAKLNPIKGSFELKHLQKIHKTVFGDIYDWAGKLRHVNIAKGNQFCLAMNLETYAENLFRKLENEHYLIGYEGSVPHRLAYYMSEINVLHPFREGNGRTQRLFIEYLALVAGYRLDFSLVSAQEMIVASADSFACDYSSIDEMFDRIAAPISKEEQKEAIKTFFGRKAKHLFEYL
ncbi:MAG: Fic family protein [Oscillospiraceae bacterium]|nr:Fic family protein [Oscillospiraceae bacterium]